ncbi:T-cell receptor gamma alternate reading frame protein [Emydura macquarii macquarii]|uniref:T-cell receptor gamma alternate reading frame protein n=1 Tax=Emydura macquarii macquarii TaxID=1129001 RepID=UPI00352A3EBB
MCLIEDFYPNVIKVTWEDDKNKIEKNAINGEIWPSDDKTTSYSVSSWLTIDKLRSKNYKCKYQHEINESSVPIESQDTSVESQITGGSINNPENCVTLFTERFVHRTAYLIYIVLLLKSTMYYVIVLFFMYRMKSPIKCRGKKP